jgi:hypothetical protein
MPDTNTPSINLTQQGGSERKTGTVATGAPLLVLKKLDKSFGATHALKAVDLVFLRRVKSTPSSAKTGPANRR